MMRLAFRPDVSGSPLTHAIASYLILLPFCADGMEEIERPVADKATNPRVSQACQRCRSLKTRCLTSERTGTCQRYQLRSRVCTTEE